MFRRIKINNKTPGSQSVPDLRDAFTLGGIQKWNSKLVRVFRKENPPGIQSGRGGGDGGGEL